MQSSVMTVPAIENMEKKKKKKRALALTSAQRRHQTAASKHLAA